MAVMNIGTYAFQMVAARILGPGQYGAIASLMALLLVIQVLQLGLQATAARRIAADPEHVAQIESEILRVTYRAAFCLGGVLLLLTPLINTLLQLDSLATAALVGVTAVPLTVMGGYAGILQGERRWLPLSALYVAVGLPRVVLGTALMLWEPTALVGMVAVAVGLLAPIAVGLYALRRDRSPGRESELHGTRPILREILHNSQALLAFFALSNADVIVARNVLSGHDSGLYAGGLILTKAVLFLPQFVVILAFPAMASAGERLRALARSLVMVAALGAFAVACAWLLDDIAIIFVGGNEYAEIQGRLWLFAVLGTALAMLQLLVYAVLARQGRRSVYLVWIALIALVGFGLTAAHLDGLLGIAVAVDVVLLLALVAISFRLVQHPVAEDLEASEADSR